MKLKKSILLLATSLGLALSLTACGQDKALEDSLDKKEPEGQEDLAQTPTINRQEEQNTINRIINLTHKIVDENFESVEFTDSYIVPELEDAKKVHISDIYLFINEEDKSKAEARINEYSQIFESEFSASEDYEELVLIWRSPNHDESNPVELEFYE